MIPLTPSEHFGDEVGNLWGVAINALHAFAQKTKAPAGYDVIAWFDEKSDELQEAACLRSQTPEGR